MTLTAPPVPQTSGSRAGRVRGPLLLAGGVLVVSVALHLRDPHDSGSWGYCPWFLMTGSYCPGCGGLRAVNDLTHGDLAAAASSNLYFVASIPVLVLLWARGLVQRWRGVRRPLSPRLVAVGSSVALVLLLVFAVARNLPAGSWLAP
jgi:hypothetical protein